MNHTARVSILFIIFIIQVSMGLCQSPALLSPKTVIYTGIYNELVFADASFGLRNISISADTGVSLEVKQTEDGHFWVRPMVAKWDKHYWSWSIRNQDVRGSYHLFIYEGGVSIDTIPITIKKLPEPELVFHDFGHGFVGSWIRFDSIEIKSDLFDELGLQVTVDSFTMRGCVGKDEMDSTLFVHTNYGARFTGDILEKVRSVSGEYILQFGDVFIKVQGVSMTMSCKQYFRLNDEWHPYMKERK